MKATQPIDEDESVEDALYRKRENSATPVQLHFQKKLYGECYLCILAFKPEIKAVSYAGVNVRMFNKFVFKAVVACSFWVARVITGPKSFEIGRFC